jgi:hypothetical protein
MKISNITCNKCKFFNIGVCVEPCDSCRNHSNFISHNGYICEEDKLIEKIVYMIFNQKIELNDPSETIEQIKLKLMEELK